MLDGPPHPVDNLRIARRLVLIPVACVAACAHSSSLSEGASDIPTPGICGEWSASEGPGALLEAVAREAGLSGAEAFHAAGQALERAALRDLGAGEYEYFRTEDGCVELIQYKQIVASVTDPGLQISLEAARAHKESARVGAELGLRVHVGLSMTGERLLTGQSVDLSEGDLRDQLAEGWVVTSEGSGHRGGLWPNR